MKKNGKSRQSKGSIARLVMGLIKANGLDEAAGKDAAKILLPRVKKQFPGSAFKMTHVYWYLSRYRKQVKEGLPVDHLTSKEFVKKAKVFTIKKKK